MYLITWDHLIKSNCFHIAFNSAEQGLETKTSSFVEPKDSTLSEEAITIRFNGTVELKVFGRQGGM